MDGLPDTIPYDTEIEAGLLGALLVDVTVLDRIGAVVREADFFRSAHRAIFRAIFDLAKNNQSVDVLTVCDWLAAREKLDDVGGQVYVGRLMLGAFAASSAMRYAEIVRDKALLRALMVAADTIGDMTRRPDGRSTREILDRAQALIMGVSDASSDKGSAFVDAGALMADIVEFVDAQHAKHLAGDLQTVTGFPTGFADVDERTTGFQPGQLVIVAARPAMGKSAFALNLSEFGARSTGKTVVFFSLEMSNREQGLRLLASEAHVNVQRLVTGRIYEQEWPRVAKAQTSVQDCPLVFCEVGGLSVMELRLLARRAKREYGELGAVVVDYLQLMAGYSEDANRANQVAEITRGLKLLAKELMIPVIVLSQLNRGLESRANKRPQLSDLRESGAIEQDADVVLFIYRDEVYNPKTDESGIAEIITAKQRNGPTGFDRLHFRGDFTRFMNLSEREGKE